MTTRLCAHCGHPFEPRPQVPDQAFCSAPECQRARKREWQRAKLQSDPDYRINQQAAQRAWSQRNHDYWRNHRDAQQVNGDQGEQPTTAHRQPVVDPVKMDVSALPSGIYRITRRPEFPNGTPGSWVVEITLLCESRNAGQSHAGVPARVARKLISLVSRGQNVRKSLLILSFRCFRSFRRTPLREGNMAPYLPLSGFFVKIVIDYLLYEATHEQSFQASPCRRASGCDG